MWTWLSRCNSFTLLIEYLDRICFAAATLQHSKLVKLYSTTKNRVHMCRSRRDIHFLWPSNSIKSKSIGKINGQCPVHPSAMKPAKNGNKNISIYYCHFGLLHLVLLSSSVLEERKKKCRKNDEKPHRTRNIKWLAAIMLMLCIV